MRFKLFLPGPFCAQPCWILIISFEKARKGKRPLSHRFCQWFNRNVTDFTSDLDEHFMLQSNLEPNQMSIFLSMITSLSKSTIFLACSPCEWIRQIKSIVCCSQCSVKRPQTNKSIDQNMRRFCDQILFLAYNSGSWLLKIIWWHWNISMKSSK